MKTNESIHVGFRRTFDLAAVPASAQIHLFAYTRYKLFVNGEYVGRGPNRFENRRPEYDTWDIAARLHAGSNVIAVLVHRDWPGESSGGFGRTLSRIRRHEPGFTAQLELVDGGKKTIINTDESCGDLSKAVLANHCKIRMPRSPKITTLKNHRAIGRRWILMTTIFRSQKKSLQQIPKSGQ